MTSRSTTPTFAHGQPFWRRPARVAAKVDEAYFEDLGMNTVDFSVTQNAEGAWATGRTAHGRTSRAVQRVPRLLARQLHGSGSPVWIQQSHDPLDRARPYARHEWPTTSATTSTRTSLMDVHPDWTTKLYLPDGSLNTERWDEYRLTTWFDTFSRHFDLSHQVMPMRYGPRGH